MPTTPQTSSDAPLYTYVIASGDMRYIEINQRNLYLRRDPNLGLILRGELPGCGAGCYADLSQVLFEYAMTCEGCKSPLEAGEYVATFGKRLGELLAQKLELELASMPVEERPFAAVEFLLKSMVVAYSCVRTAQRLEFTLESCPLCETGNTSGMGREMALARHGFAALCASLVASLAPGWRVVSPAQEASEQPLLAVVVEHSS
jgi:hypothetical protein